MPRCSSRTRVRPRRTKRRSTASVALARTDHSGISDWPARPSGTRCTPRPIASAGWAGASSSPSSRIPPPASGRSPNSAPSSSVLPAPISPVSPSTSPRAARGRTARCGEHLRTLEPDDGRATVASRHAFDVIRDLAEHRVDDAAASRTAARTSPPTRRRAAPRRGRRAPRPRRDDARRRGSRRRARAAGGRCRTGARPRGGQRRGRLVEHEQPRRARERPGERDQLALGHAQARDVVGERGARELAAPAPPPPPPPGSISEPRRHPAAVLAAREAVEQQVLRRRHPRHRPFRGVLVDRLDPRLARLQRRAEPDRLAVDLHGSGVRRQHAREQLVERRLARAVGAHDGEHLAAGSARLTSRRARVEPNDLETPSSSIPVASSPWGSRPPWRRPWC